MSRHRKHRPRTTQHHDGATTTVEPLTPPAPLIAPEPTIDAQFDPAASLRAARLARGITLDHIAFVTKITPARLVALETGDLQDMPAEIYLRNWVKSYAKEVGLDPDKTAELYLAQLAPRTPAADAANADPHVVSAIALTRALAPDHDEARLINTDRPDRFGRLMTFAAAIGLVAYLGPVDWNSWTSNLNATAAAQPAAVTAPAAETAPAPAPEPVADVAAGPLQFEISPQGPCWFSASADGSQAQSALLGPGDNRTIEVRQELVLRVGDPGACAFTINGRSGRALGSPGAPVTVRITKDNFRELLRS